MKDNIQPPSLTDEETRNQAPDVGQEKEPVVGKEDGVGKDEAKEEIQYPHGLKLVSIMLCIYCSMFLTLLDRTILATAIPRITNAFHSINDIGWYGSAFLLTSACTLLIFGKIYTFYSIKLVYISCLILFEVGSAICGAATSSPVFILGRAIAGFGSSGLMTGAMTIMIYTVPLRKRPLFMAPFFAIMGISNALGPLLGGLLTDHVSWRWCFYINLPLGGAAIALLSWLLHLPPQASVSKTGTPTVKLPFRQQMLQLDPLGTIIFLPGMICLLLGLTWGGTAYPWSSWRPILLLVLGVILLIIFVFLQLHPPLKSSSPTVPFHVLANRSIYSAFLFQTFLGSQMMLVIYYLPIYFQTVLGFSPTHSGVAMLPLVISLVIGSFISGGLTFVTGYYTIPMLLSATLAPIGTGLLTIIKQDTKSAVWIGLEVICGLGIGTGTQNSGMTAQTVLSLKDQPVGTSLMFFGMMLGGSIVLSGGQAVFGNQLKKGLGKLVAEGRLAANIAEMLAKGGATEVRGFISNGPLLLEVLAVYDHAVTRVFCLATGFAAAAMIGAAGVEWKSVKKAGKGKKGAEKTDEKVEDKVDV